MARIRTIKPTHWADKELPKISLQAHLLWIATWNISDDDGVFEADALLIRSQVFPRRTDIRVEQVQAWLDQLVKARFILPFTFNGNGYYINRTFKTHQRIDKPQPSLIPDNVILDALQERSKNVPRTFPPVEESNSNSNGGEGEAPTAPPPKAKSKPEILFCESEIFDKKKFSDSLKDTQYSLANVDYYHEVINNWSNSKGSKKKDWLATAKNWMAKDMTEGKFIKQDFIPPTNGQSNSKNGKPATGAAVNTGSAFSKIDAMYGNTGRTNQ